MCDFSFCHIWQQQGTAQSPKLFQLRLSFAHLAFSRDEFNECIQFYRTSGSEHVLTDPVVGQIEFSVKHQPNEEAKYHPGLLISCIELIVKRCKSEEEALLFIGRCGIIRYLEARCLVVFRDILQGIRSETERAHRRIEAPSLDDQAIDNILRDCIYQLIVNQKVGPNDAPGYSYCQQLLVKYCYCYQDDQGCYVTTCPLIRAHLIKFMVRPDSKGNTKSFLTWDIREVETCQFLKEITSSGQETMRCARSSLKHFTILTEKFLIKAFHAKNKAPNCTR